MRRVMKWLTDGWIVIERTKLEEGRDGQVQMVAYVRVRRWHPGLWVMVVRAYCTAAVRAIRE